MYVLTEFQKKPLHFRDPVSVIRCFSESELGECFAEVEEALAEGLYVAGFLSYEAGYSFEKKLSHATAYDFPLLYFGCYKAPASGGLWQGAGKQDFSLSNLSLNLDKSGYANAIHAIRSCIEQGEVYQITYCIKTRFDFEGSSRGSYRTLLCRQPVPYPAYIEADGCTILSCSPEMFLRKNSTFVETKPMKGTWPRGKTALLDSFSGLRLKYDAKNRAENVMIADLLRNDLGRVGNAIRAPRLFEVRRYSTLYQMTSTVTGHVAQDIPVRELFRALFPSGSVTGAPKIRAMEVIRELEREERRIYTGAIGYITPGRDMFFNIPIRTILLRGSRGEMGIGGGIVWDSTADGEWAESMLKAQFITDCVGAGAQEVFR
jgi:para-aminobenzoate synthetase / 4-amino-4-deoxychorismate lyase